MLLFLPGASGNGSFWDPIRALLPHHRSDALDWPGLGDAPADPKVNSYADLVRLVIAFVESSRSGPEEAATLVGQSMGGWVATRVAVERPDLVDRLVLAVTSAGVDVEALGATDWRPGARRARPQAPEWTYEWHAPMEAELAALTMPALLLWADADPISPLAVGRRIDELRPQSELVIYESDDHWFVLDHTADVARRIANFM